jgi:hypothetical protein
VTWVSLNDINSILVDADSMMYVIRGNHDNPAFWYEGMRFDFSNIVFVKDDTQLFIDGKSCYFSGGAISIDRLQLTRGVDYWPDECHMYGYGISDGHANGNFDTIDYVFTHDVYHQCSPFNVRGGPVNEYAKDDHWLIENLMESQAEMKLLYEDAMKINPNFSWYHGHYHKSCTTINGNQKTYCLAELEMKEVV